MKVLKNFKYLLLTVFFFIISSCVSTPNYKAAKKNYAQDVSGYADFILENCKLPDGKIATVYVFNSVKDGTLLQDLQTRKFSADYKRYIREKEVALGYPEGILQNILYPMWLDEIRWSPTGPLSSFWKLDRKLYETHERKEYVKIARSMAAISYFKVEDLGDLSPYMSINSMANACYEDSDGVYLITIGPPKELRALRGERSEIKKHKGQLAYEVAFMPKRIQSIQPPKTSPAIIRTTKIDDIPNSDIFLEPSTPKNSSSYYYDENLAYQLQWLAVKVACIGTYDMAYTGNFSAANPRNYYETSFIKYYLAKNDGRSQRGTILFEGICFDYADFTLKEFLKNKKSYNSIKNCYMVGTFDNCNDIIVYRIAKDSEIPDTKINGTPVVVYGHNHTQAHENVTHHAWVWIQTDDGTVYWVDPTWTDNTGRPVYGIVRGGREIELSPDPKLCVY